jgi:hypothetical protein
MNFTELLEHSNVDKSVIEDFENWLFHLKDIKGYSKNTYHSYCYDICDFFIFYHYYHQEPLSHGILPNLNLQTFRAWVADMAGARDYQNVYKKTSLSEITATINKLFKKLFEIFCFKNRGIQIWL